MDSQKLGFFVKTKEFIFHHYILTKFSCCSLKFLEHKWGEKMLKTIVKMLRGIKIKHAYVIYEWSLSGSAFFSHEKTNLIPFPYDSHVYYHYRFGLCRYRFLAKAFLNYNSLSRRYCQYQLCHIPRRFIWYGGQISRQIYVW